MTDIKRYTEDYGAVYEDANGEYCFHSDHAAIVAALQEQVQKLSAENVLLIELSSYVGMRDDYINYERVTELRNGSPATDAFIREIGAKAVDDAVAKSPWLYGDQLGRSVEAIPKEQLFKYAAKLRTGEQP